MRRVLIIIAILLIPAIPIVLVVTGVLKSKPQTVQPVALSVWGTADDAAGMQALISRYRQTRSYITITYTKVRPEDYANKLISAWAKNTGPDIFFVPSSWIGKMSQYAIPMPHDLSIPQVIYSKGLFGTSVKVVTNPKLSPSLTSLKATMIESVTESVIRNDAVWGLPLSVDTLVAYYNKDLLNNAKIFEPAATWGDLKSQIEANHLTVTDQEGRLVQSGVALGTINNLPYATDLLGLLMLQNGSVMTTADGQAHLNDAAGLAAVKFYLSFAQPDKSNYSWDETQTNARDAFLQGKVAYFFGTLADRQIITASSLNWGTTPMFHIRTTGDNDGRTRNAAGEMQPRFIDAAQFSVAMVSKASDAAHHGTPAWNFVEYASQAANVATYLKSTKLLSAQRSLLAQQQQDPALLIKNPDLSLYAKQLLTARSWYHGNDGTAVDGYLQSFVTAGLAEKNDLVELLNLTNTQIQSTL